MARVLSALITECKRNGDKVSGFCVDVTSHHIIRMQWELVEEIGDVSTDDWISITLRTAMGIDQES